MSSRTWFAASAPRSWRSKARSIPRAALTLPRPITAMSRTIIATIMMTPAKTRTTITEKGPIIARTTITPATTRPSPMTAPKTEPGAFAELPLLLWLSPAFPVGAFAYSHGLEWAVEVGDIVDEASLRDWLADLLKFGAPRNDAILFALAFRAVNAGDWADLTQVNELAIALTGSAERRLESLAQGGAFLAAFRGAWRRPALDRWPETASEPVVYPVA